MRRADIKTCSVVTGVFLGLLALSLLFAGLSNLSNRKHPGVAVVLLPSALVGGALAVYLMRGARGITHWLLRMFPEHHRAVRQSTGDSRKRAILGMGIGGLILCLTLALVFLDLHNHWIQPGTRWTKLPGVLMLLGTGVGLWGAVHLARYKGYPSVVAYATFGLGLLLLPLFGAIRFVGGGGVTLAAIGVIPLLPMAITLVLPVNKHRPHRRRH